MRRTLFLLFCMIAGIIPTMAGDDVTMLTRNGETFEIRLERITTENVYYMDLKKKKRGIQTAPRDYVYMIKTEKKNTIFFDEKGEEKTVKSVKVDDKDDVVYLMSGKEMVVYNLYIKGNTVSYKLSKKKKDKTLTAQKSEIFMIRHSDGYKELFADTYKAKPQAAAVAPNIMPSQNASTVTANIDAQRIVDLVYAANPYTLYKKGATATYGYIYNSKDVKGPLGNSFVTQKVTDVKFQNGKYVAYCQQEFLNSKREESNIVKLSHPKLSSVIYPTAIDTAGTFYLTHDVWRDDYVLSKRKGFAVVMSPDINTSSALTTNKIISDGKTVCDYTGMKIVGEEDVTTPCGTFHCMKLSGRVTSTVDGGQKKETTDTVWMAKGIGMVKHSIAYSDNTQWEMYLLSLSNN